MYGPEHGDAEEDEGDFGGTGDICDVVQPLAHVAQHAQLRVVCAFVCGG